ncbi:MAG TPA: extracellular solute-binding protein [Virgibacillus sp.]|nr:extracellular solute-binding protein [Virgibacillus sp.]HLR68990.1 extracellular solute-binding protein [Virgibacillus sp.]
MQTNHLLTYRNFIILFALFLSFGLLSACAADDNDDEADNDDSETLTLYNGQHKDATTALIDAFEDKTDIEVEERDGSSNELAHQITEEGDQSPADLIYTEESSPLIMLTEEGLLSEIDEDALESIPSEYQDSKNNWTGILARSRVVAYNQEMIKEHDLPDSVLDFAKPEWDGKFAFVPTSGAFQMQLSALIKLEGKETAKEWLEGLKEHGKIYKDNVAALEAVENGEIELGLINNYYWDRKAKEEGEENLDSRLYFFGTHDIGDMLTVASMGILESSSHKEEAQQFIEFATSEEGQQILTDESSQYPLNDKADTEGLKPFSELTPPEGTLDLGEYSNGDEAEQLLQDVGLL